MRTGVLILTLMLGVVCSLSAHAAKQLDFMLIPNGKKVIFDVSWVDSNAKSHRIEFALPRKAIKSVAKEYTLFFSEDVRRKVENALDRYTKGKSNINLRYEISKEGELKIGGDFKNQADYRRTLRAMYLLRQNIEESYLRDNMLININPFGAVPDYARLIKTSLPHMQPIAEAFKEKVNPENREKMINTLISFARAVPPAPDLKLLNDFTTPLAALTLNKADDYTRIGLIAALICAVYPDTDVAMVYTNKEKEESASKTKEAEDKTYDPDYNLLLAVEQGDLRLYSFRLGGKSFVPATPLAAKDWEIGKLPLDARTPLENSQFVSRIITKE